MKHIVEIAEFISSCKTQDEIYNALSELLTESELQTLSKRWRILKKLFRGDTQREIAKELGVSLCKVTRGSKIIKDTKSIISQYLIKEKNNGN